MNLKKLLRQHYSKLALAGIFAAALILRWLYLPQGAITFGYDQGRDAFLIQQILAGHLKIQGPPVGGLPGIFHGVFYYYVITPAYLFGRGNPIVVAYWMSFLNALGVFLVYKFTSSITGKKIPGLISALVYAFSFEATQYANWLSNPALGILFVPGIYYGIWLWFRYKFRYAPIITGVCLGLSIQCNAALAYHILPVAFWLYLLRDQIKFRAFAIFVSSFTLSTLTMIISEIKFNAGGFSGLWYLFSSQDKIAGSYQFGDFLVNYLNQVGKVFSLTLFPLNNAFGGLLGMILFLIVFLTWAKERWSKILSWQTLIISVPLSYAFALSFGGGSTPHITVGIASLTSVALGAILYRFYKNNKIVVVSILTTILLSNLVKIISENKNGQTNFSIQPGLIFSSEIKAVDYTYKKASGSPFSISTLTSPLFVNTTWSYIYNWYGISKYGYLPYWIGHDQIGQLGNNLKVPPSGVKEHFFIIEPTYSIPDLYIGYAKGDQNSISSLKEKVMFGTISVEERTVNGL